MHKRTHSYMNSYWWWENSDKRCVLLNLQTSDLSVRCFLCFRSLVVSIEDVMTSRILVVWVHYVGDGRLYFRSLIFLAKGLCCEDDRLNNCHWVLSLIAFTISLFQSPPLLFYPYSADPKFTLVHISPFRFVCSRVPRFYNPFSLSLFLV